MPWETLRRLLGLPSGTAPPSGADLVRLAIEQPSRARLIGMALIGQPPKEGAAGLVLGALDRGQVSDAVGAELLGCVGHGSGYGAVAAMLFDPSASAGAVAAAGPAMARILGRRAEADLSLALRMGVTREAREGAALGLTEVGSAEAAASIAEAACEGRIRARLAASCAVRLPFDAAHWIELLEAEALAPRRVATEVVYALVMDDHGEARDALTELGDEGRRALRRALDDEALYMLPDKRRVLEGWLARR